MTREELKQMVRDLRDNTPCDEHSQRYCGCEKFDEIIDAIDTLGGDDETNKKL